MILPSWGCAGCLVGLVDLGFWWRGLSPGEVRVGKGQLRGMDFSVWKMSVWGVQLRVTASSYRGFILSCVTSKIPSLLICWWLLSERWMQETVPHLTQVLVLSATCCFSFCPEATPVTSPQVSARSALTPLKPLPQIAAWLKLGGIGGCWEDGVERCFCWAGVSGCCWAELLAGTWWWWQIHSALLEGHPKQKIHVPSQKTIGDKYVDRSKPIFL